MSVFGSVFGGYLLYGTGVEFDIEWLAMIVWSCSITHPILNTTPYHIHTNNALSISTTYIHTHTADGAAGGNRGADEDVYAA